MSKLPERHNQYRDGKRLTWYVPRILELAASLPVFEMAVAEFHEVDSIYWFDDEHPPTCRSVIEHARRIALADLNEPVIVSETGMVMDGMHRICRALMEGVELVKAIRFETDPEPDEVRDVDGVGA